MQADWGRAHGDQVFLGQGPSGASGAVSAGAAGPRGDAGSWRAGGGRAAELSPARAARKHRECDGRVSGDDGCDSRWVGQSGAFGDSRRSGGAGQPSESIRVFQRYVNGWCGAGAARGGTGPAAAQPGYRPAGRGAENPPDQDAGQRDRCDHGRSQGQHGGAAIGDRGAGKLRCFPDRALAGSRARRAGQRLDFGRAGSPGLSACHGNGGGNCQLYQAFGVQGQGAYGNVQRCGHGSAGGGGGAVEHRGRAGGGAVAGHAIRSGGGDDGHGAGA